jgi:hypothetical protein
MRNWDRRVRIGKFTHELTHGLGRIGRAWDESGTGRDESAVRAGRQPLVQAAQNVVPVAVTAGDKIESLRQWASGRCLSADRAGVYSRAEAVSGGRVRRVVRAD